MGTGNIRGTLCKVYHCLTTTLYTWNQYKIILKVNFNWKIKIKNAKTHQFGDSGA